MEGKGNNKLFSGTSGGVNKSPDSISNIVQANIPTSMSVEYTSSSMSITECDSLLTDPIFLEKHFCVWLVDAHMLQDDDLSKDSNIFVKEIVSNLILPKTWN